MKPVGARVGHRDAEEVEQRGEIAAAHRRRCRSEPSISVAPGSAPRRPGQCRADSACSVAAGCRRRSPSFGDSRRADSVKGCSRSVPLPVKRHIARRRCVRRADRVDLDIGVQQQRGSTIATAVVPAIAARGRSPAARTARPSRSDRRRSRCCARRRVPFGDRPAAVEHQPVDPALAEDQRERRRSACRSARDSKKSAPSPSRIGDGQPFGEELDVDRGRNRTGNRRATFTSRSVVRLGDALERCFEEASLGDEQDQPGERRSGRSAPRAMREPRPAAMAAPMPCARARVRRPRAVAPGCCAPRKRIAEAAVGHDTAGGAGSVAQRAQATTAASRAQCLARLRQRRSRYRRRASAI